MNARKSRILKAAAAASVAAALGLTAACGGGGGGRGDDDSAKNGKAAERASTETAGAADEVKEPVRDPDGPLTEAQLEKAAIRTGDVKGFKIGDSGIGDLQGQSVPAAPAACQPVADMFLSTTDPGSRAAVSRGVGAEDETDASVTTLVLFSYGSGDADEVLAGLREATDKCTAYEHTGYKYTEVKVLADPGLGDDSVAYRLVASIEGATVPAAYTVVRDGTTLAVFASMNMLDADKAEVPEKVIEAQLAKLRKAAG
ncbi:hypothetical protein [Streptomyces sp. NPDC050704]|uniref:hypothetical protein n=1 Tax=Streptomyces sp. NPDC050704 TaxID=3157219 RepID=UPI00341E6CBC